MDKNKIITDTLLRIRALWVGLEELDEGSPEYHAQIEKIRVLSAEYLALTRTAKKPD